MKTDNLVIKDIENLFHPATNLVVHEDSKPLILDKGEAYMFMIFREINI